MRIQAAQLLAHRGCWTTLSGAEEFSKNSINAILKAQELGFGLETDIRDQLGNLVISHDPPTMDTPRTNLEFLADFEGPVALNVKSDGLVPLLLANKFVLGELKNLFFFDMSLPESLRYKKHLFPIAQRVSELEPLSGSPSEWIWLDCFESDWYLNHLDEIRESNPGAKICVVSPELHQRPHGNLWKQISGIIGQDPNIMLCTDYPQRFLEDWG